jgi:hypothetical protein
MAIFDMSCRRLLWLTPQNCAVGFGPQIKSSLILQPAPAALIGEVVALQEIMKDSPAVAPM